MEKAELYSTDVSTLHWQKSSLTANNGDCFELAGLPDGGVAVRDSKNTDRDPLFFNSREWAAFKGGILKGDFDNL